MSRDIDDLWHPEWATPANPTDKIAAVVATPAVAPDAQQHDWRKYMSVVDVSRNTFVTNEYREAALRLAAHIERLEAERDALLAEHHAVARLKDAWEIGSGVVKASEAVLTAHDNVERVMHDE